MNFIDSIWVDMNILLDSEALTSEKHKQTIIFRMNKLFETKYCNVVCQIHQINNDASECAQLFE